MNDRFTYQKGDIQIRSSQCDFCKFNCKDEHGDSKNTCTHFPNGKPDEINKNLKRCPLLEHIAICGNGRS